MKNVVIIPSGGTGKRFKSRIPKQYMKVLGKELIVYTLEVFQNNLNIDSIIISAQREYFDLLEEIKNKYSLTKVLEIVEGGPERQDSVFNALTSANLSNDDFVIVHDAARPLLSNSVLDNSLKMAHKYDSVVVAISARDTLINGNSEVNNYIDRNNMYYAQTPQIFRFEVINKAFTEANSKNFRGTDESMLVKNAGFGVKIVDGEFQNFKITTQEDINLLTQILDKK